MTLREYVDTIKELKTAVGPTITTVLLDAVHTSRENVSLEVMNAELTNVRNELALRGFVTSVIPATEHTTELTIYI